MHYPVFLLLTIFLIVECENSFTNIDDDNPVVTIENGPIRGRKYYTVGQNKSYYAFQGIPYAEPPLGNLRFSAPVKASKWIETLNATNDGSQCVQDSDPVSGSEDCLFLNVYTPSLSGSTAVMVYIYGGAFVGGNSAYSSLGPDYFLDEDVIFVSMNYRLGIFGFISTGDTVCSGNWGLKDQVLALEWVRDNIKAFGGNHSNVTVFGESAGGASVSYLLQTNKTRGLFNAAIMQSGTSLNLWSLNRRAARTAFSVGKSLGIDTTNSSLLIQALKEVEFAKLQTISATVSTLITLENALEGIYYGVVIEPDYEGALFVNKSHELLSQGGFHRIPTIIGFNSNEAAAGDNMLGILRLYFVTYDIQVQNYAPADLTTNSSDRLLAGIWIRSRYINFFGSILDSNEIIQFISDDQFNRPIRQAVLVQSKYAPVYCYVFAYEGLLSGVVNRTLAGVGHAEDLGYLFRSYYSNVTESDALARSRLIRLWTNFAKYGNPTPTKENLLQNITWEAAGPNPSNLTYLNIDSNLELRRNPFEESMTFYDNIYSRYGEPPYDTY